VTKALHRQLILRRKKTLNTQIPYVNKYSDNTVPLDYNVHEMEELACLTDTYNVVAVD